MQTTVDLANQSQVKRKPPANFFTRPFIPKKRLADIGKDRIDHSTENSEASSLAASCASHTCPHPTPSTANNTIDGRFYATSSTDPAVPTTSLTIEDAKFDNGALIFTVRLNGPVWVEHGQIKEHATLSDFLKERTREEWEACMEEEDLGEAVLTDLTIRDVGEQFTVTKILGMRLWGEVFQFEVETGTLELDLCDTKTLGLVQEAAMCCSQKKDWTQALW